MTHIQFRNLEASETAIAQKQSGTHSQVSGCRLSHWLTATHFTDINTRDTDTVSMAGLPQPQLFAEYWKAKTKRAGQLSWP